MEFDQWLLEEVGAPIEALEDFDVIRHDFGFASLHLHSLFGITRQLLFETETGAVYDIPKDRWEEIVAMPTAVDVEMALQDRLITKVIWNGEPPDDR